uniref:Putative 5'-3' exoribonuclease n=1 Tax=Toxoplasma gondii COUG TaxID=1074873 RepID=A0A2G8XPY9_TOXGO|nr:putative 5'-3' exoribonuclease [Toxoplasma gondii COUG]
MGVPTFYRWLCSRYPRVVIDVGENHVQEMREELRQKKEQQRQQAAKEKEATSTDGQENNDAETTEEDFAYDCLYLDMNGIIHPCCHTDDGSCPATEEEMFLSIFQYVDRIVDIIRPRQLLYLAIDGVAPRAKMNQQRSRRFKAAKDIQEEEKAYAELRAQFESEGREVPPKKMRWDSNVITPGTPFMHRLADALTYYIQDRLATNENWKGLRVIFSDATVPGEGEHKIMDFIRQQRKSGEFCPNLRHVLHGADADLIMLGLATHEANFSILREAVVDRTPEQVCSACGAVGHSAENCPASSSVQAPDDRAFRVFEQDKRGLKRHLEARGVELREDWATGLESHRRAWKPLQMLQLPVLREYLAYEFITSQEEGQSFDLERCIDDFVFLCFLCGNDFLPHLPHQSIQRGSIDALVQLYLQLRPQVLTDYLTREGRVNLPELYTFLHHLAIVEKEVVRRDLQRKSRMRERTEQQKQQELLSAAKAAAERIRTANKGGDSGPSRDAEQAPELSNENAARLLKHQLEARILAVGSSNISQSGSPEAQPAPAGAAAGAAGGVIGQVDAEDASVRGETSGEGAEGAVVREEDSECFEEEAAREQAASADGGDMVSPPVKRRNRGAEGPEEGGVVSVSAGKKREADFDMFKAKLSQKLNREIDGDTLLKDEVDGGVGCPDRATWRQKYYRQKFHLPAESDRKDVEQLASDVALAYIVGLQWVLLYYYQGCNSFDWFFPFHYAPLAVDLADELQRRLKLDDQKEERERRGSALGSVQGLPRCGHSRGVSLGQDGNFEISFTLGTPFRAFEQLMAVLPPYSASCLPREHAAVMMNPRSAIADFYPSDVKMDPNGKRHQWQWVVLLPFIDENRLLRTCKPLEKFLTLEERERNRRGSDRLYVHRSHPLARTLAEVSPEHGQGVTVHDEEAEAEAESSAGYSGVRGEGRLIEGDSTSMGMTGKLFFNQFSVLPGEHVISPIEGLPDFTSVAVCCFYTPLRLPQQHRSVLLEGVKPYVPILERFDLEDEERKDRAFSGAIARRIVMHCLSSRHREYSRQDRQPGFERPPWQERGAGMIPHGRRPPYPPGNFPPGPNFPCRPGFSHGVPDPPLLYSVPGGVHAGGSAAWNAPGLIPGDPWAQQFAAPGYGRPQSQGAGLLSAPVHGGYGSRPPYADVRCMQSMQNSRGLMGPGYAPYRNANPGYSAGGNYQSPQGTGYVDYQFPARGGYGNHSRGGRRDGRYEDSKSRQYGR